jgi:tetratricopeptide (TPR) repeat protein
MHRHRDLKFVICHLQNVAKKNKGYVKQGGSMFLSFNDFIKASMQNGAIYAVRKSKESTTESNQLSFDESEVNDLGYKFLNELNRIDDAIEIFQFNVSLFPNSSNAYDSLGEAYFIKGDEQGARDNYRKSLELNSANKNAQHMLRQLRFTH